MDHVERRVFVPPVVSTGATTRVHDGPLVALHGETMGTTWSIKFVDEGRAGVRAIERLARNEFDRIIAQMSTWEPESDISRFNRAKAGSWHALADDFFQVIDYALVVAEASDGAYDPTAGAIVDLWGFGPRGTDNENRPAVPVASHRDQAQAVCGWCKLALDRERRRIRQPGGLRLDLSSVAKGYAVDCVVMRLAEKGIANCLVEVGGELRGAGVKPDGLPWWVDLELPEVGLGREMEGVMALHNLSVATSGDYRRFFLSGGTRYSHTIDPRTGAPVAHNLASVTVVHASCMCADALSTMLMVLGPAPGLAFAQKTGIAARFLRRDETGQWRETLSGTLAAMLD